MSCSNMEERKKRMVVPIVAIMMCAVALVGLGYAFSSSVTSNDNTVAEGNFFVDIAKDYGTLADSNYDIDVYKGNKVDEIIDIVVAKSWDKDSAVSEQPSIIEDDSGITAGAIYLRATSENSAAFTITADYSVKKNGDGNQYSTFKNLSFTCYESTDGGQTWTPVTGNLNTNSVYKVQITFGDNATSEIEKDDKVRIKFTANSA